MNEKETALAVSGVKDFAILKAGADSLPAILAENIGTEGLTSFDLDKVCIPAGGMQVWTVPGIDGDENPKEFSGVIIFHKLGRVYWEQDMDEGGGGTPPDCTSDDCINGIGTPGGECGSCELAQFGSADNGDGKGQACKQIKLLFVMQEKGLLPLCVSLPPTSLRGAKQYMLRLASNGLPYYSVLTRFGLEKASSGSINYSKAVLSKAATLSPEETEQFRKISLELRPHFEKIKTADAPA